MTRKSIVTAGDFNADLLSYKSNGSKLKQLCQAYNLQNIVNAPTKITLLDLILTNILPKISTSGGLDDCIADDKFIYTIFKLKNLKQSRLSGESTASNG